MESLPDVAENITAVDKITSIARLAQDAPQFFYVVQNWYDVLIFYFGGCKKPFSLRFRSGYKIKIKTLNDLLTVLERPEVQESLVKSLKAPIRIGKSEVVFGFVGHDVKLHYETGMQRLGAVSAIKSIFLGDEYGKIQVKGETVLDIGAHIGDTAIYFALRGAKHVYCFEPYPHSYRLAKKNIQLNKLGGKIDIYNEACGGDKGSVNLDPEYNSTGGSNLRNFENGEKIRIETLANIIKKINLGDVVLKMDCEGYEYGIIEKSSVETLRHFKSIIMEYHYGYLNLEKWLEGAGFEVWHNGPRKSINCYVERFKMTNGLLYAKRIDR